MIKDYDLQIQYHPGKANTVADALSRKSMGNLACLLSEQKEILQDFEKSKIEVIMCDQGGLIAAISALHLPHYISILGSIHIHQLSFEGIHPPSVSV